MSTAQYGLYFTNGQVEIPPDDEHRYAVCIAYRDTVVSPVKYKVISWHTAFEHANNEWKILESCSKSQSKTRRKRIYESASLPESVSLGVIDVRYILHKDEYKL